jgi:hypothetical protein
MQYGDEIRETGSHKNKRFSEIIEDAGYCSWVLSIPNFNGQMKRLQRYIGERKRPLQYWTITRLLAHCKRLYATNELNDPILRLILEAHEHTRGKTVVVNATGDGLALFPHDNFSLRRTISEIKGSKVNFEAERVKNAFRNEIAEQVAVVRTQAGYHVDHNCEVPGKQFSELLCAFLTSIPPSNCDCILVLENGHYQNRLVDREIARQWQCFHEKNADLRELHPDEHHRLGDTKKRTYAEILSEFGNARDTAACCLL